MAITADKLKQAISQFASGVTVVTTRHEETPIGITASSFSSLSMEPPLVLVAINTHDEQAMSMDATVSFAPGASVVDALGSGLQAQVANNGMMALELGPRQSAILVQQ